MDVAAARERFARAVADAFGASCTIVAAESLHGDASSRRYVRLTLAGAAPAHVVAMVLAEGAFTGGDELGGGGADGELPFVRVGRYLASGGLPVPAVYHDASATDGFLLLEDVGDRTLFEAARRRPGAARRLFGEAVDLLVRLQTLGATRPDPACGAFGRRFDTALAAAELEHFVEHGIETRHGTRLEPAVRRAILEALAPLLAPFADGPFVLSHRDYMAWNVHVRDAGLCLIDFQDALLAPDAFDLGQLLTDRTTSTLLAPDDVDALVERFLGRRADAGLPTAPGFRDRMERCVLQHALKVIGRFHFLECVRGKPGYLAYLPAVYAVARRSFGVLPDVTDAAALIAPWVPEVEGTA
jgi:aminoglycoside/choline kinase family phosphotransferase